DNEVKDKLTEKEILEIIESKDKNESNREEETLIKQKTNYLYRCKKLYNLNTKILI
ncbi:10073_t:CDS:1, partial [Scutellospora calospora]